MSVINIFQVCIEIWGCVICIILGIMSCASVFRLDKSVVKSWRVMLLNCFILVSDALAYIYNGDSSSVGMFMTRMANFCLFSFEAILVMFFVDFILTLTKEEGIESRDTLTYKITMPLAIIALIASISNPFTDVYYHFDEANHYMRSPGIILSFAALGMAILCCVVRLIKRKNMLSKSIMKAFSLSALFFVVAIVTQFIWYGISLINIAITLSLGIIFFYLWYDANAVQYSKRSEELETIIEELRAKLNQGDR